MLNTAGIPVVTALPDPTAWDNQTVVYYTNGRRHLLYSDGVAWSGFGLDVATLPDAAYCKGMTATVGADRYVSDGVAWIQSPVSGGVPASTSSPSTSAGQAAAASNFSAIASALANAQIVNVGAASAGPIYVDRTLIVRRGTTLNISPGNYLTLADGKTCNLIRNQHAQSTVAASDFDHTVSGICTVRERGHSRVVGDIVYIHGVGGDATLLGPKTITSVAGEYWSFSASGTGTATGYGYVAPYVPMPGSAFVRGAIASATCNIATNNMTLTTGSTNPFVDGMTVSGGTLSGQTIRGPYGNTIGAVGELWNLSSSGGTQTGITVTGTPPATLVSVLEVGHTKKIGDQVFIHGLTSADSMNGPHEVAMVLPDYWFFHTSGTTAETATGTACVLHDNDIKLSGAFDGNYRAQQNAYTDSCGVVLGNCSKIDLTEFTGRDCFKYAFWGFNISDVSASKIRFKTRSDGLHFEAPWNRVNIFDAIGENEDDIISFTNNSLTSTWPALSSPSGQGNGDNVVIKGVQALRSKTSSCVKVAGDFATASHTVGSFSVDDVFGSAQYGVYANSGIVGTGTKGTTFNVRNVVLATPGPNSVPVKFNCGATGGFESVVVDGVPVIGANNAQAIYAQSGVYRSFEIKQGAITLPNTNPYFQADGNATFTRLKVSIDDLILPAASVKAFTLNGCTVEEIHHSGRVTGSGNNGWLFYLNSGVAPSNIFVSEVYVGAINQYYAMANTVTGTTKIHINRMALNGPNAGFVSYNATTINATGVNCEAVNNFFFAPQSTTTCRLNTSDDCVFPSAKAIRNAAGTVNSASGAGIKIDIGASGASTPTGMTPIAGDRIWNTNAVDTGLYGRTNAGAWQQIF